MTLYKVEDTFDDYVFMADKTELIELSNYYVNKMNDEDDGNYEQVKNIDNAIELLESVNIFVDKEEVK